MPLISSITQESLLKAREDFAEGLEIPPNLIPDALALSWERSRSAGLTPYSRGLDKVLPERLKVEQTLEDNQWLISHVQPEMQLLWQSLKDPYWTLLCINNQGLIIHHHNSESATTPTLKYLSTGRVLLENEIGTTAPGCSLREGRPIIVDSNQHYLSELDKFFCAAVPIRTPEGHLLGVLDVTGVDSQPPLWLQERLNLTALAIENRLYLDFQDCSLLHVHADPRLIDTPLEGIIAVDPEGRLLHANRSAKCLLGLDQESALKTSTSLETLFGVRGQRIFDKLRMFPDETHSIPLINGHPLFARLRSPTERVHSLQSAAILSSSGRPPSRAFAHDLILEKAFKMASQAFAGEVPILMQGETGTGKEVFAKALHDNLAATGPFVAINCSAIPSNLIEAELFGYSDGAFTGGRKGGAIGKIELANGGTLFLDEIGDMPLDMQTRLLRVLQERNLCRIGDTRVIPLDFRLLSASHRNLEALVAEHTFREDLFYRINGFCVTLPALRERSNLAALIDDLLQQLSPNLPKTLSPAALKALLDYSWPGNVRQLQQALKVACIFSGEQSLIDIENFPPDLQGKLLSNRDQNSGQSPLKRLEIDAIHKALAQNQGNISATASQLGLSRSTLYKKLRC